MAYVCGSKDEFTCDISKDMYNNFDWRTNKAQKLYVVYLKNMITNDGIWKSLNSESKDGRIKREYN